ncbi:MAG: hypothetical protein AVDCRST_MAG65-467, partial [uncultured Solirubrobacteraceae bacterium]
VPSLVRSSGPTPRAPGLHGCAARHRRRPAGMWPASGAGDHRRGDRLREQRGVHQHARAGGEPVRPRRQRGGTLSAAGAGELDAVGAGARRERRNVGDVAGSAGGRLGELLARERRARARRRLARAL